MIGFCVVGKVGMAVGVAEGGTDEAVGAVVIVGGGVAEGVGVSATGWNGVGVITTEKDGVITLGEKMSAGADWTSSGAGRTSCGAERGTKGAATRKGKIR